MDASAAAPTPSSGAAGDGIGLHLLNTIRIVWVHHPCCSIAPNFVATIVIVLVVADTNKSCLGAPDGPDLLFHIIFSFNAKLMSNFATPSRGLC